MINLGSVFHFYFLKVNKITFNKVSLPFIEMGQSVHIDVERP